MLLRLRYFIAGIFSLLSSEIVSQNIIEENYRLGLESYASGDYSNYLRYIEKCDSVRGDHPVVLFHLTKAYCLNEEKKLAYEKLSRLLLMNAEIELLEDSVISDCFYGNIRFSIQDYQHILSRRIHTSSVAFENDLAASHPESMSFNSRDSIWYFGTVGDRAIYRQSSGIVEKLIDFESIPELYSVMGLDYDTRRKLLWAVTAILPETGLEEGKTGSSVVVINRKGRAEVTDLFLSEVLLGDIILDTKGRPFFSDGNANKIYWKRSLISPAEVFIDLSEEAINLQGLTFSNDGKYLFVSDYIKGIFRINIETKEWQILDMPVNIPWKGIDGLYFHEGSLIAIANGTLPVRVIKYNLDSRFESVIDYELIDQAVDSQQEPTQGVIFKKHFYFIGNSPWSLYGKDGKLSIPDHRRLLIFKVRL